MSVLGQISAALMNGDVKRLDQLITKNKLPINVFLESQQTLLQCATANNLPDIVFYLLQKGINIAITEKDTGATPLHTAAQKGFCRVLRMLLEHGANPNARDANGGTALHYATQEGQVEACQILIEKNAPLNAKAKFDVTPLHLAVSVNQPAVCQVLLDHQANPEMTTTKGMTPLHIACFKNNGVILDILIRNGANPKALTTQSQRSGMHFACINGSLPISLLLARLGVDCMQPDIDGKTPIDLAIAHNHPELPVHLTSALQPFFDRLDDRTVVRILCTVAKGTRDFRFLTNMLLVCKRWYTFKEPVSRQFCMNSYRCRPNLRIVPQQQSLSASGSSSSRDNKRSAPLPVQLSNSWTRQISVIYRLMSCYGSGQMNAALILAMGASLSSPASINTKPALSFEQLLLLEILRLHKPLNKEASALLAYEPGHCIRTLLEHGTDPNCLIVPSPPPGQPLPTALQMAIHSRNGILRDGQSVKTCDDILQLLVKAGADSNRPDPLEGNSPLHWAAIRGEESSLRILADTLGGNINQKNNAGDTPILLAARHCQWACVGALLERSADLSVTNNANETLATIVQNHANAAALSSSGGAPGPSASGPSDPKKKVEKPLIRVPSEPLRTTLFTALGLTPPASPAPAPVSRPRPPAPARQGSVSSLATPGGEGPRPVQRQGSAVIPKNSLLSPKAAPTSGSPNSPLSNSAGDPGSPGEVRKPPPRRVSMKPPGQAPLPSSGGSVPDADTTPPSSPLARSTEPEAVGFADSTASSSSSSSSSSNASSEVIEDTEEIFEYTEDEEREYRKRVEEEKKYAAADVLSPLHQAAMECEATTLFTLLEAGSDVNQINKCGSSAVHIAAWFGSLPCMKHLINFNADLNLRNRAGDTAYSLARLRVHKDMLDFFHQHYSVHVDRTRGMYLEPLSK